MLILLQDILDCLVSAIPVLTLVIISAESKLHHRCFPSFKMLPAVKASPPWAVFSVKRSSWNCRPSQWLETLKNQPLETTVQRLFPLVDIETFWKDVLPPPAVLVSSTSGFHCELCHQVAKDMKRSHVSRSLSNLSCGLFFKIQHLIVWGHLTVV